MILPFDPDYLLNAVIQLRTCKSEVDDTWSNIQTLVGAICDTTVFDDDAASAYLEKMESYQTTMTSLSEFLEHLSYSIERLIIP